MGSRIMPAMSDSRSFTNYVSGGLYNNYLEDKFKTTSDSSYRMFLQNNTKQVMQVVNGLTAYNVTPPKMPKVTKRGVVGDPDAQMTAARYGDTNRILNADYYKNIAGFNSKVRG